jgi:hypothetical protein
METITKKCNNCKKVLSVEVFGDNGKNGCFKTCDSCRASGRERKARAKFGKDVKSEVEPDFIIIPCNLNTVVSRNNIFFINEKIHDDFGDEIYGTAQDEETITIFMNINNTENDFEVKLGDTWGEIRENIHRAAVEKDVKSEVEPINLNTIATDLNLFLFLKEINDYCEGLAYTTITHKEKIEVLMGIDDFEVIHGDTWAEVRENIQRCHGLLEYRFI